MILKITNMPINGTTVQPIFGLMADAIQWSPEKCNAESWQQFREILKKARDGANLIDIRRELLFAGWIVCPSKE